MVPCRMWASSSSNHSSPVSRGLPAAGAWRLMQVRQDICFAETKSGGVAIKRTTGGEKLVRWRAWEENRGMRALAGLLVFVGVAFGIYYFYLKKMPTTDEGTASTQAISLTGVRSDLLQIAQAERGNVALNSKCVNLDELISSGALAASRTERDGYTYSVNCTGTDFEVVAEHPAAAAGTGIRYPKLAIDATMAVREVQ
jgi:hypothetical protein